MEGIVPPPGLPFSRWTHVLQYSSLYTHPQIYSSFINQKYLWSVSWGEDIFLDKRGPHPSWQRDQYFIHEAAAATAGDGPAGPGGSGRTPWKRWHLSTTCRMRRSEAAQGWGAKKVFEVAASWAWRSRAKRLWTMLWRETWCCGGRARWVTGEGEKRAGGGRWGHGAPTVWALWEAMDFTPTAMRVHWGVHTPRWLDPIWFQGQCSGGGAWNGVPGEAQVQKGQSGGRGSVHLPYSPSFGDGAPPGARGLSFTLVPTVPATMTTTRSTDARWSRYKEHTRMEGHISQFLQSSLTIRFIMGHACCLWDPWMSVWFQTNIKFGATVK